MYTTTPLLHEPRGPAPAVITVDDEVEIPAGTLREHLGQAMGPRGTIIVVDASSVTSLDSADLRELLAVHTRLAASGRTLVVRCPPSPVATFLEHAGVSVRTEHAPAA